MVYVFLADGFEEVEALTPIDVLRRAGVDVRTVGVTGKTVTGSHGVPMIADLLPEETDLASADLIFLPGGMPGTKNLSLIHIFCLKKIPNFLLTALHKWSIIYLYSFTS